MAVGLVHDRARGLDRGHLSGGDQHREQHASPLPLDAKIVQGRAASLRALDGVGRAELRSVRNQVAKTLTSQWSDCTFEFEHGPGQYGSVTGCGVDQAHLQFVRDAMAANGGVLGGAENEPPASAS